MKNKEYFKDFDDFEEESQRILLASYGSLVSKDFYSGSAVNKLSMEKSTGNSGSKDDEYINLALLTEDLQVAYKAAKGSNFLFEYKKYLNDLPQTYILDDQHHHINISAKISLRDGAVQVSNLVKWDRPFMEMYLDNDHRLNFTLSFKYEDAEDVAIVLKTTSFESFKYLLLHIGYGNIETDKNSVQFFTKDFTYFLNNAQTGKELAVVYSQLPLGFIKNINLTTSKVISQLTILAKEDNTGWFSWTKDTSSLLIKTMGMFRNYKEVADFFWKNPKLLTEIYDKLDGTSEVLGISLSNRIIFTSILNNIARNGSDLKNRITKNALLSGKGYSIESNILELNDTLNNIKGALSLDWDFDYKDSIFLQQKKTVTQTVEQRETDEFGKGGSTTEQTVTTEENVDPGYLYHPLHLVHYLDQETKKADLVTALFLKAMADEKEWAEVMRCIRIGGDIIAIFAGLFTMGVTGQASVLAIADLGLATADLIMMNEDVKQFLSQYTEGKWFVDNWDVIYGLVGMGILSVVMIEGILTYGPALVEKLKNIKNLKANYRIFTKQLEKMITELDAYQAKNATTAIEEVIITGGQNNLLKKLLKPFLGKDANFEHILQQLHKRNISVKKSGENLYDIYYKGKKITTLDDKEAGLFLRTNFYKTERQLLEAVKKLYKASSPESSLLIRGKYLGQALDEFDFITVEKFLSRFKVELQIGIGKGAFEVKGFFYKSGKPLILEPHNAAMFVTDGIKMKLILRENATVYEILHELMHMRDCRKIGMKAFLKKDLIAREKYVYDKMVQYSKYLNRKELKHSEDYINIHYERAGKTDNLGNPIKETLPFNLYNIPKKRQEVNIDKILNLK